MVIYPPVMDVIKRIEQMRKRDYSFKFVQQDYIATISSVRDNFEIATARFLRNGALDERSRNSMVSSIEDLCSLEYLAEAKRYIKKYYDIMVSESMNVN